MPVTEIDRTLTAAFDEAQAALSEFAGDPDNLKKIHQISRVISTCFASGKKLLICGNGGSACQAMHMAEEFTGRFRETRKALPALALTDPGHLTCVANDFGYDAVFARGIEAFGQAGDVLVVLSTSGNSRNIISAIETAASNNLITIALLGKGGGALKGVSTNELIVPGTTSDRIQELHMTILHCIIEQVERLLFCNRSVTP